MHQKDYRGEQISRGFIYNMSMMGDSEFCSVFPEVKWLCIFWGCGFFQIIYIGIVFETLNLSSIKYTHMQKGH